MQKTIKQKLKEDQRKIDSKISYLSSDRKLTISFGALGSSLVTSTAKTVHEKTSLLHGELF